MNHHVVIDQLNGEVESTTPSSPAVDAKGARPPSRPAESRRIRAAVRKLALRDSRVRAT
ncbi:MAG: hypothetical protein KTR31_34355 [Myxococcales bacterium]|nr:hypothetical protein [Myxococcales bacterium]